MSKIKRVAVFGSGTMGMGIAGICANAGCQVVLLDMQKEFCDMALPKLTAGRSPVIEDESILTNITTGDFENDMQLIAECQWICEAIVEDVAIKRKIFKQAEQFRADGSIITTNTSGIPLRDIYTNMPDRLQQDIAVTHFFNPVHVMKLVELVPGENTRPEVISELAEFLGDALGKGVVYAKDTVNFIGNRIGCMWISAGLQLAEKAIIGDDLTIEEIDALMGEPMGLPATGLFGLVDLIGLDVMAKVNNNLSENLPDNDPGRVFLELSPNIQAMLDRGQLGRKTGGGFYKLIRHGDGSKSMKVFDIVNHQWRDEMPATLGDNEQSFFKLFLTDNAKGRFVKNLMATTLCYSADLVPEISDDIVNVDRAMRWGFGWQKGPFELIDQLGAENLIELVNAHGMGMPNMLQILLDSGETKFYRNDGNEYLTITGSWASVPAE